MLILIKESEDTSVKSVSLKVKKFLKNKFLKKKLMNFILFFISTGDKAFSCPGKRKKHVKKMHPNAVWEGK